MVKSKIDTKRIQLLDECINDLERAVGQKLVMIDIKDRMIEIADKMTEIVTR